MNTDKEVYGCSTAYSTRCIRALLEISTIHNSMSTGSASVQQCLSNINHQSKLMKESLTEGNLLPALKHCMNFLNELRTSLLTPKEYYELYIAVFDSLEYLSSYLKQSHQRKLKKKDGQPFLADLYELVQYLGNIVPRLYMMIVIGTTYMATNSESTKEIMKDMIEMCKGVQHPIRGLFLRNYLSQRTKDLLPIETADDLDDTVDFLMTNFIEMNKLWVRLQHQGHSSERELRLNERKELKVLVGSNLVRLSQAIDDFATDEADFAQNYYKETVYPIITEQIIQCKDPLAQSYLIDVLIQIFPDNFHFQTIDDLLNHVFVKLSPSLKKSELISSLIDRFVTNLKYESDLKDVTLQTELLGLKAPSPSPLMVPVENILESFFDNIDELHPSLPPEEICLILQSLIKLTLNFQPDYHRSLERIFEIATKTLKVKKSGDEHSRATSESRLWFELLVAPVQEIKSIKNLLKVGNFRMLYEQISDVHFKRQLSLVILDKLLNLPEEHSLGTTDDIDEIFAYLVVLIEESDSKASTQKDLGITKSIKLEGGEKVVAAEFLTRQEKLSKCLHLIHSDDYQKTMSNLFYVKKKYLSKCAENTIFTYPTLVSRITALLRITGMRAQREAAKSSEEGTALGNTLKANFKNLALALEELYQHHPLYSELILKLYLNVATIADQLEQETIAYELFQQVFVIFEESLSVNRPSKNPLNPQDFMGGSVAYQLVVATANTLASLRYFSKENYEDLITKTTIYGSKLLKKQDQCRAIYNCAHMWWWCDLFIEGPSPSVHGMDNTASAEKLEDKLEEKNEKEEEAKGDQESPEDEPQLYRDGKRVLECLQKALRVADSSMDPYLLLKLFVEILNRCVIFNVYGNWYIDARYINGLIDLIRNNIANLKEDDAAKDEENRETRLLRHIELLFDRTLEHIAVQQETEGRLQGITV